MIQLRYFASLREALGTGEEQVELPGDINDLNTLRRWLQERDATWKQTLADSRLHVAINQQIVNTNAVINDGCGCNRRPGGKGGFRTASRGRQHSIRGSRNGQPGGDRVLGGENGAENRRHLARCEPRSPVARALRIGRCLDLRPLLLRR